MCARVVVFAVLVSHALVSRCVILDDLNVEGNSKIELSPLLISAGLNDIIVISLPIVDDNTLYYFNKPNGDIEELHLNKSRVVSGNKLSGRYYYNDKYLMGELKTIISPLNEYRIFNFDYEKKCFDTIDGYKKKELMSNDFRIGPLHESDHGNWILSAYYKENDQWIELFQVITIEIKETVPVLPAGASLHPGEDLHLRFAHPLRHLESCEIIAPRSTFDRFYNRDHLFMDSCGFCVPNVTAADGGMWRILGVGDIVYEATVLLRIKSDVT